MKYLIASDLHGSAYYCKRLLDAFHAQKADRLVLLGDLLYHGPRNPLPEGYAPMEVVEMLSSIKEQILCVRGNCDADVDQMVLPFPILADYAFIAEGDVRLFATHGHNYGPDKVPPMAEGDYLLCGHIHLPVQRNCGSYTYLNPGSTSLPKENTPHSYMTLENGVFTWFDLDSGNTFTPLD